MWHKTSKRFPKKTDYFLVTDGLAYSVAVYSTYYKKFFDRNADRPIEHDMIKYWRKIPNLPRDKEKLNIPGTYFHF